MPDPFHSLRDRFCQQCRRYQELRIAGLVAVKSNGGLLANKKVARAMEHKAALLLGRTVGNSV